MLFLFLFLVLVFACNDLLTPPLLRPSYPSLVSGPLTSFFSARDPYLFVLHCLAFAAPFPCPLCALVRCLACLAICLKTPSYISRKPSPHCTSVSSCDSDTRLDRSCGLWRGCRGRTGVGEFWCRCCRLRGGCST
jgi:hypothetical protein